MSGICGCCFRGGDTGFRWRTTTAGIRVARRRNGALNQSQRLAVAMNRFAAVNGGRLPPAAIAANGRPPHSWRVELLPYLDREDLYAQYRMEEPWDSPANRKVLAQIPAVFRSPFDDAKSTNSGYFAIVTPRAAFEGHAV